MNYLLLKLYMAVFGINKVLAKSRQEIQTPNNNQGRSFTLPNPLRAQTITDLVDRIAGYLIVIAAPIVTIMILFAAFKILTAGDNPENIKSAKQMILWTCVGYGIILISKGITLIIKKLLGVG